MKNSTLLIIGAVLSIIIFFIGYFLGKSSVETPSPKTITEIRWIKGDIIRDTIKVPVPYEVKILDSIPVFVYSDTLKLIQVWEDYYVQRKYNLDFSNDTIGTFIVDAVINQNKLVQASSFIQPNIKTIYETKTITRVPTLQFFAIIGSSITLNTNKVQFGIDIKQKYLVGISGVKMNDNYNYTIDLGIKF